MTDNSGLNRGMRVYSNIEGEYQETYTPTAGRIRSPQLGGVLKRCKMLPVADGSVTWKDLHGNENTMFLYGGQVACFYVSEISVAAGGVKIVHDGEIDPNNE
jgi:hypothetical protein